MPYSQRERFFTPYPTLKFKTSLKTLERSSINYFIRDNLHFNHLMTNM